MTLKELKDFIRSIGQPVDRIAGFCDNYEQMFDRCHVEVEYGEIVIDTSFGLQEDSHFYPVSKAIADLLALPNECDDYPVFKSGLDSQVECAILHRQVRSAKVVQSAQGAGICLLGRETLRFIDEEYALDNFAVAYHVEIIIEDPRAQKLNEKFEEFLYGCCKMCCDDIRYDDNTWNISNYGDVTIIDFVAGEATSDNLIALITGAFDGIYFSRTPLTRATEVERLCNDSAGKYYGPLQAVVYPAYVPDKDLLNNPPYLTEIADSTCYAKECATADEMEQYIAGLNPDDTAGDLVRRINTRYIADPLTLILE
ncbi:MAG: hypothetical protein J6N68_06015 [Shewanella sp.]|nr:hypothetical protein [Shewanella sp.]